MLFNSLAFILAFFPVVFVIFFILGRFNQTAAGFWLCLSSLFFYGFWDATYLWLLIGSIVVNYSAGYWIARSTGRISRIVLTSAVLANLLVLSYYKYFAFFTASFNSVWNTNFVVHNAILPLGISFFTFTQIAFLVDAYQGKAREFNFVHYLLFVTYFPHLIAGPILHHAQMMPQFARQDTYKINWNNIAIGLSFFILGLAKKVYIADTCAGFATPVFDAAKVGTAIPFIDAWLGAYAYTLQLYFDFSGYCDMAIGISYAFNIRLPYNFNSPYKAVNIVDFWHRWHMTLSAFLRDYLYIPLGGNRHGKVRRYINLALTMLLGGLWHGAGWTFILWGALHGFYLVVNHAVHAFRKQLGWKQGMLGWPGRAFSTVLTFIAVLLAWVLFRSENMLAVQTMFSCMTGGNGFALTPRFVYYCKLHLHPLLIPGLIMIWALPNTQQWIGVQDQSETEPAVLPRVPSWWRWVVLGILFGLCILKVIAVQLSGTPSEFLYYQF